jgi:O-antigen/teichoic acid export membrane protein
MRLIVIIAVLGSAAGATLFMCAPLIAAILMQSRSQTALAVIRLTAFGVPAAALAVGFTYALQATGSHDAAAKLTSVASVITILTTIIGVCLWGVQGAAMAWVVRQFVLSGALLILFVRRFRYPAVPLLRLIVALVVLIVAAGSFSSCEAGILIVAGRSCAVLATFLLALAALKIELIPGRG